MAAEKGIFMQEQAGTRMKEAEVGGGWGGRTKSPGGRLFP